jgi:F0F1-type ATP synthase membrane subunit a
MKFLLSELLRTIVRSWRLVGWVLGGAVIAALAFVIFLILWVARGSGGRTA